MNIKYSAYVLYVRWLLEYIRDFDAVTFNSRFEDIDGDGFDADMVQFVDTLNLFEKYFERKSYKCEDQINECY